jgi:hypothetical protein
MLDKIKEFIKKLNDAGIPLPMIRIDGKATFTGTMTFISFNTALLGQIGKVTNLLGPVDLTQANYLFLICLGAYLGRKIQGSKDKVEIESTQKEEKENK